MKTLKQFVTRDVCLIFFLSLCLPVTAFSSNVVPEAAKQAAVNGLPSFLKAIPEGELGYFGFSNQTELDQVTLGDPFEVYTISPELILNYTSDIPVEAIISSTPQWLFPVLFQGGPRALLTVYNANGEWNAVSIGAAGIAKEWFTVKSTWPAAEGYEHIFVRVFQATSDFVLLIRDDTVKMIPLESGQLALGLEEGKAYDPSQVLQSLKDPVQSNMSSSQ